MPITHSAYMLNAMWKMLPSLCAKAEVRNRHGSLRPSSGTNAMRSLTPGTTSWARNTARQMPMIVVVTTGRPSVTAPPKTVRPWRTVFRPSATQSTHWMPTAAGRWHSGQAGRMQRWHRTYDSRSGCRGHTGTC